MRSTRLDPRPAALGIDLVAARALVADLHVRRAARYWTDFLASAGAGYLAVALFDVARPASPRSLLCFAVAVVALYRAAIFTHEIAHTPPGELPGFRPAWNVLCGVPLLVPSFLYEIHPEHHAARSYGTVDDGEYAPFATASRWRIAALLAAVPVGAPALVLRFLVVAPLGWLVPPLRRLVFAKGSALVIDGDYRRDLPGRVPASWTVQEAACTAYTGAVAVLALSGRIGPGRLLLGYAVVSAIVLLNALRVLGAHRYTSGGRRTSFEEQVLDSVDYPRGPLAELWAPLGLRYHATHHLFPRLPYHALPEARRRLWRSLPPDSPFRRTAARSLPATLAELLRAGRGGTR